MRAPRSHRLSFLDGASALLAGAKFIARSPRSWPAAAVPAAIATALSVVLIWLSFDRVGPWLGDVLLPDAESWYARGARSVVRWVTSAMAAYLSLLVAVAVTPPLSAPALEHLVRLVEVELGAASRPAGGFWFELRCELEAQVLAVAVAVPIWVLLWVLGVMVPPLVPFLVPLQAVLVSLAVAWNLLGYPLTLRGVRASVRLRLMADNTFGVLGFGAAFAGLSLVPGVAILLLPAGVAGATRLVDRMMRARAGNTAPVPASLSTPGQ